VKSSFPSKIASFFGYGTVDVLTEWDSHVMLGTMSMYYVTDPDGIVTSIQSLLDTPESERRRTSPLGMTTTKKMPIQYEHGSNIHSKNIQSKIAGVLR
jgi:ABC-type phosphate transport system permease subunit